MKRANLSCVVLTFILASLSWHVFAFSEDDLAKLKATKNCLGCDLTQANLTGADLSNANLTGAKLHKANLHGTNLTKTDLTGAALNGADLTGAKLESANLTGARLYRANLTGAIFCETIMPDVVMNNSGCQWDVGNESGARLLVNNVKCNLSAR